MGIFVEAQAVDGGGAVVAIERRRIGRGVGGGCASLAQNQPRLRGVGFGHDQHTPPPGGLGGIDIHVFEIEQRPADDIDLGIAQGGLAIGGVYANGIR